MSRMFEKMAHSSKEAKSAECRTGSKMAATAYCPQGQFQIIKGLRWLSLLPAQGPGHLELLGRVEDSFNRPAIPVLKEAPSNSQSY